MKCLTDFGMVLDRYGDTIFFENCFSCDEIFLQSTIPEDIAAEIIPLCDKCRAAADRMHGKEQLLDLLRDDQEALYAQIVREVHQAPKEAKAVYLWN